MASRFKPGEIFAGKYRIERNLGSGGMGQVFAATHLALGQPVAIKVMLPELTHAEGAQDRFFREARAAGQLRSEHIVEVKDISALPDGMAYIVMELLEGRDLARLLRDEGRLRPRDAVDYVEQACLGLADAHAHGIVHRDIKPANMLLTRRTDGRPLIKLLDFGISKMADGAASLTRTSVVMGSVHYTSPEQLRSARDVDVRSDVWSMGVSLYELVAGKVPFPGESFIDVGAAIARDEAPPLANRGLDEVVRRCLQKDPARRWQSVAELARALVPFGSESSGQIAASIGRTLRGDGSKGKLALPLPARASDSAAPEPDTTMRGASAQSVTLPMRRLPWPLIVLGAAAGGGLLGLFLVTREQRELPAAAAIPAVAPAPAIPDAAAPDALPVPPAAPDAGPMKPLRPPRKAIRKTRDVDPMDIRK